MASRYFSPSLFKFQKDLAAHNERDWFQENKERYQREVKDPALRFIVDFGPHLLAVSPHFRCDPRPHGGSLHRIYRDIRFSKDKSPYKVWTGIYFPHDAGRDFHTPGFYLHLQPGACFAGMGIWHPDNATLKPIRQAMADEPDKWRAAVGGPAFRKAFTLAGDSLVRPPRGFDADHPLIEDIKRKDFIATTPLSQKKVASVGFLEEFAGLCRVGAPLVRFICEALKQPF